MAFALPTRQSCEDARVGCASSSLSKCGTAPELHFRNAPCFGQACQRCGCCAPQPFAQGQAYVEHEFGKTETEKVHCFRPVSLFDLSPHFAISDSAFAIVRDFLRLSSVTVAVPPLHFAILARPESQSASGKSQNRQRRNANCSARRKISSQNRELSKKNHERRRPVPN